MENERKLWLRYEIHCDAERRRGEVENDAFYIISLHVALKFLIFLQTKMFCFYLDFIIFFKRGSFFRIFFD